MFEQEKLDNLINKIIELINKAIDNKNTELAKDLSSILDKLIA
jgi:hemerythrin